MEQHWMVFKDERNNVRYFWDGEYPILVYVPSGEDKTKHYWMPIEKQQALSPSEVFELNTIAESRKKVFFIAGRKQRYIVESRGSFTNE